MRRTGPQLELFITTRVGILIVFGIMPLMRGCDRIQNRKQEEIYATSTKMYDQSMALFDKAQAAIDSNDVTTAVYWMNQANQCVSNRHEFLRTNTFTK